MKPDMHGPSISSTVSVRYDIYLGRYTAIVVVNAVVSHHQPSSLAILQEVNIVII